MNRIDFDRVALLLNVFHSCHELPGTELIRAAALQELRAINATTTPKAPKPDPDPQGKLDLSGKPIDNDGDE